MNAARKAATSSGVKLRKLEALPGRHQMGFVAFPVLVAKDALQHLLRRGRRELLGDSDESEYPFG
jgi:hypothetical protein